ncbi:MAG: Kazal-type serine protease inhibitor family protein [Polyangiales bacterium]
MNRWRAGLCMLTLVLGVGCAADATPETDTEAAPEAATETEADDALASQADALTASTLYFTARRDVRRCAFPRCGGSFVRALNRGQIRCADGTQAPECYVADLDLDALGLSAARAQQLIAEQHKVVFLGALRPSSTHRGFGALVAKGAFRGVNETAAGATLLTKSSGIVCIQAPCPTHIGVVVNRGTKLMLTSLDLSVLRASDTDLARVQKALANDGVLLSGRLGVNGNDASLGVTQAYLPVGAERRCGSRGLPACGKAEFCQFDAGTCGELDRPGVCTPRPQACIEIFRPVCGCDGKTYGNSCQAAAAGVSVDQEGACEPQPEEVLCGGIVGRACPGAGTCVFEDPCPPGAKNCPVCSDCTGVCACSGAAVLCGPDTFFDDSPRVCACVPRTR